METWENEISIFAFTDECSCRTCLYSQSIEQATVMSARLTLSPTRKVRVFRCWFSSARALLTSSLACSVACLLNCMIPRVGKTHALAGGMISESAKLTHCITWAAAWGVAPRRASLLTVVRDIVVKEIHWVSDFIHWVKQGSINVMCSISNLCNRCTMSLFLDNPDTH